MEIIHGFMEITYTSNEAIECAGALCGRLIAPDDICFVDTTEKSKLLCKYCGPCARYHRKKAQEREAKIKEE